MVGRRDTDVALQLLVDVDQRRRDGHASAHGEAQPVGLARSVVRVLAEDHHLRLGVRREVERGEHLVVGRVHRVVLALGGDERLQVGPVRLGELAPQDRVPVRPRLVGSRRPCLPSGGCPLRRSTARSPPSGRGSTTSPGRAWPRCRPRWNGGPGCPGGARLWVKRDDLTGLGAGGNKARKLEFLCAEALRAGARSLVTVGAGQSNHCRMTAAAGAVLGLEVHLVLSGNRPATYEGNQLLAALFGAQLHFVGCPPHHWGELEIAREQLTAELEANGAAPHAIPIGGSTATGALGYALAFVELVEQCDERGMRPAAVVHASSSGGTHAGLVAGRALLRAAGREELPDVLAVGVAKGVVLGYPDVRALAAEAVALVGADPAVVARRRCRDGRPLARRGLRHPQRARRRGHPLGRPPRRLGPRPHLQRQGLRRPARQRRHRPLGPRRRGRLRPHRRRPCSLRPDGAPGQPARTGSSVSAPLACAG